MAVHDKTRLLSLGLPPRGLVFEDDAGMPYLPFHNVPYELETIVARWLLSLPPQVQRTVAHGLNEDFKGLTPDGWAAFTGWMVASLHTAQELPDFQASTAAAAQRHFEL